MKDNAYRMLNEARDRIFDANILARSGESRSDSQSLIRILGFEILLKCAIHLCGQVPKNTHNYLKLWKALPGYAQKEILHTAKFCMPGHTDFSDLDRLLSCYQFIFEKGRFFYEIYDGYTSSEIKDLSAYWVELGSPTCEADIQYYPLELISLIEGLDTFVEKRVR